MHEYPAQLIMRLDCLEDTVAFLYSLECGSSFTPFIARFVLYFRLALLFDRVIEPYTSHYTGLAHEPLIDLFGRLSLEVWRRVR